MNTKSSRSSHDRHTRTCNDFWSSSTSFWGKQTSGTGPSMGSSVGEFKKAQTESERNLREYEKSLKEPTAAKSKIQKPLKSSELTSRVRPTISFLMRSRSLPRSQKKFSHSDKRLKIKLFFSGI